MHGGGVRRPCQTQSFSMRATALSRFCLLTGEGLGPSTGQAPLDPTVALPAREQQPPEHPGRIRAEEAAQEHIQNLEPVAEVLIPATPAWSIPQCPVPVPSVMRKGPNASS